MESKIFTCIPLCPKLIIKIYVNIHTVRANQLYVKFTPFWGMGKFNLWNYYRFLVAESGVVDN